MSVWILHVVEPARIGCRHAGVGFAVGVLVALALACVAVALLALWGVL